MALAQLTMTVSARTRAGVLTGVRTAHMRTRQWKPVFRASQRLRYRNASALHASHVAHTGQTRFGSANSLGYIRKQITNVLLARDRSVLETAYSHLNKAESHGCVSHFWICSWGSFDNTSDGRHGHHEQFGYGSVTNL